VQARDRRIVLVLRRSFGETTTAVDAVKRAFMWAALAGLATALLVGFALASGVVRRLRRLRDTTERVAEVGPEAELLEDPLHDEVGDLSRSFAAMQTQLRRQEQARRTFVSTASHELRTPLTALELMLDALAEDLARPGVDAADASRQVGLAQEQTRRLTRLAQDLLELSRVDAGLGLREDLTEVGELCRGVVTEFEAQAATRDLRIELVAPEPSWAVADPGGVVRIVRILVDNALRFSPPGEAVVVTVAGPPTGPAVTVADSGPGVPEPERERIFERFERGTAASGEGGFGLGLAIGRELARRMGGELSLDDAQPTGARFVLGLPIELPSGSHHEGVPAPAPR
jgi:signal transduction histidine kinase